MRNVDQASQDRPENSDYARQSAATRPCGGHNRRSPQALAGGMMSHIIIPEDEVVVALDTGVVRNLCHDTPAWVDTFEEMAKQKYHFCLSDVLLAEILNQLERKSITQAQWQDCIRQVTRFVSKTLPFLPGKRQLFNMSGIREKDVHYDFDPMFEEQYSQAIWKYLSSAPGVEFLKTHAVMFSANGKKHKCKLQFGDADKALADEREYWIEFVKQFNSLPKDRLPQHEAEMLENMKAAMDSWSTGTPPLSIRADLLVRFLFEVMAKRSQSKEPYNPEAKKKKNDGIDFLLNFAFILPALLCATDGKFVSRIRSLSSYQNQWVYTPDQIAAAWKQGNMVKPSWPDERA